jgi:hypothetical protein
LMSNVLNKFSFVQGYLQLSWTSILNWYLW